MNISEQIKQKVPNLPGCYIYFDQSDKVIYVGKAKDLKKRMLSYFNRANNTKTQHLVSKIAKFDYYITKNENEALILENNLIKKYNPFYNIVLKDDKSYPYLLLTQDKHPRLIKTRVRNKKGKYFGPYSSATLANQALDFLNTKVPLRKCKNLPKEKCIYYDIKQCYGPCIKKVDQNEVKEYVNEIEKYLKNDMKKLKREVYEQMLDYANRQMFEQAQSSKEFYELLNSTDKTQGVQLPRDVDIDYIDYYKDDSFVCICILKFSKGKLINIHRSLIPYYDNPFDEISAYLYNSYEDKSEFFNTPKDDVKDVMENLVLSKFKRLEVQKERDLEEIAQFNAREYYKQNINKITSEYFIHQNAGYEKLQNLAQDKLHIIEMIDISHIGGDAQVGAVVVYKDGKKEKNLYRKYKIKNPDNTQDDYGSIREVLTRRYKRAINDNTLPDMLIVDGGKGQVSSALEVLHNLDIQNEIKLIGLSKDDKHKTKGIVNKNLDEKIIPKSGDLYKFLYDIQEEVHRFAIDYHRKVKVNSLFQSELDQIPGIGPKRRKMLIEHFDYVDNIKKAKYEDFKSLNLSDEVINNIMTHFAQKGDIA